MLAHYLCMMLSWYNTHELTVACYQHKRIKANLAFCFIFEVWYSKVAAKKRFYTLALSEAAFAKSFDVDMKKIQNIRKLKKYDNWAKIVFPLNLKIFHQTQYDYILDISFFLHFVATNLTNVGSLNVGNERWFVFHIFACG